MMLEKKLQMLNILTSMSIHAMGATDVATDEMMHILASLSIHIIGATNEISDNR